MSVNGLQYALLTCDLQEQCYDMPSPIPMTTSKNNLSYSFIHSFNFIYYDDYDDSAKYFRKIHTKSTYYSGFKTYVQIANKSEFWFNKMDEKLLAGKLVYDQSDVHCVD